MAYKRAELLIVDGQQMKVIAWVELPEEDAFLVARDADAWFQYVAKVTPLPEGARFRTRMDYMTALCPKRPRSNQ